MAAAGPGGPGPDLYQLLGVSRDASREEIAQAWRHRARAEHPDSRPGDAAAPGRFRALAGAWHVLSDPVRRAAYDQELGPQPPAAAPTAAPAAGVMYLAEGTPMMRTPGAPLRAGPVRVEVPRRAPAPGSRDEEEIELVILALRYLAWEWDLPW